MSTPCLAASACVSRAVGTPSATCPSSPRISSRRRPVASRMPTVRLRDRSPVAVRIRSPMPVRPMKVSARAPSAAPRRAISARPRVINAARALSPRPSPSLIPAASAMTFFTAPPISTPVTSSLEYTRRAPPCRSCAVIPANFPSFDARVNATGRPRATSAAKLGPDNAPRGCPAVRIAAAIWWGNRAVSCSKPLQSQITGAALPVAAKDRRVARSPATAGAAITRSFFATVSNPSSGATPAGSGTPGRNASLTRRSRIAAARPSSRAHS